MKKAAYLILIIATVFAGRTFAQSNYQQRFNDCNAEQSKLRNELDALRAEEKTALQDFANGYFCSDCKRSRTEVEKSGTNFNQHIQEGARSGRRVVQATQQQIAQKQSEYENKIHNLEVRVDSKRLDCERINADYVRDQQQQQQQAQERARQQQEAAQQQAQQQFAVQQQQAQAAAEALRQQKIEAARRMQEELERRRMIEAQKAAHILANTAAFNDQVSSNNDVTQQRLDEHRANSTLDNVANDSYRDDARNTVNSTSSSRLGDQAFSDGMSMLRSGVENAREMTRTGVDYIRQKAREAFNDEYDDRKNQFKNYLFGDNDAFYEETPSVMQRIKTKIREDLVQKVRDKIFDADRSGNLKMLYDKYTEGQADAKQFEDGKLRTLTGNLTDHVGRLINAADPDADPQSIAELEEEQKTIFRKLPQNLWGIWRNWRQNGNKALVEEITD
jgi:hypothetical protein